ncbi:hypothetical protein J4N42_15480 [Vibrio sp. SCSIO 43135]|uniref:DUF6923 family protein n=1 Tax=Vibrio sp. SCSIO 43135 TaxID=2819096 RepID=UPI002074DF84|nr:hypothetical protein [Vibrio sp. SCSIO 43135]USD43577.1 hypothetical protein J4N42_15480 [Vibrio sp. SCSIO 43135]
MMIKNTRTAVVLSITFFSGVSIAAERCDVYSGSDRLQCESIAQTCKNNPHSEKCVEQSREFLDRNSGLVTVMPNESPDQFQCNGFSYLVQGNGNSDLIRFNPYGDESEFVSLWQGNPYPNELQAIGHRDADGYLYGWDKNQKKAVRIRNLDSGSAAVEIIDSLLPDPDFNTVSGDVYNDSLYLFNDQISYKLDLESLTWTPLLGATGNFAPDMAFMPSKSSGNVAAAYGLNEAGQVVKFTETSGSASFEVVGNAPFFNSESNHSWGGAYAEADSSYLYVSNNNGSVYKVNVDNLNDYEKVGDTNTPVSNNDGAHCTTARVGSFHLYYLNNTDSGQSAGDLVEDGSGAWASIGTTPMNFSTEFTESSAEMINNDVTPGSTRAVGFNYAGENVDCGDVIFRGPVIAELTESDSKAGVRTCTIHYEDTYISITNSTGQYFYPAFDSVQTTDWFADSFYGWLNPSTTRLYWGDDEFLTNPAIDIKPGDVIEKIGYTDGISYYECDSDVVYEGQLRYDIVNGESGLTCIKR